LKQVGLRCRNGTKNKTVGPLIRAFSACEAGYSVRELAALFDRSASTIQHHLNKERTSG
jgi:transposase